jgi:hypothetical protein
LFEVDLGLRESRKLRWPALATLAFATVVLAPVFLHSEIDRHKHYRQGTIHHLEADLTQLGGSKLSGHIQCLDMTLGGCITTLYRKQLVQSTGYIYDFYLFPEKGNAVTAALQKRFLAKMAAAPPTVIVLSSHTWPGDTYSYSQLERWPAFQNFLERMYRLRKEQPMLSDDLAGYRIYTLKQATD